MKKIRDMRSKDELNQVFLVKYLAVNTSKDGKKYLNVIFTDGNHDLEGRVWNNAEQLASQFQKGDFLKIQGKTNYYQGRLQLIVQDMQKAEEGSYKSDDFQKKSAVDPQELLDELSGMIEGLSEYYIKALLKEVLADDEIRARLLLWPAAKSIHHAYQGGLLEHIVSCGRLSLKLSEKYDVNESYVFAGAFLHDLCKVYELTQGPLVDYTDEGRLVGHLVKAVEIIDRFSYRIKGFPGSQKSHLKHVVLAHHGEYAYGSPKIPQTPEAMLVHLIDFMDSKMQAFKEVIETDTTSGSWSGYVKHLDRMVYKKALPSFTEPVATSSAGAPKPKNTPAKKKSFKDKELKQNLGSMLKDFPLAGGEQGDE